MDNWITPPPGMQYDPAILKPPPPGAFVLIGQAYKRRDGAVVKARSNFDEERANAGGLLDDAPLSVSVHTGRVHPTEDYPYDLVALVLTPGEPETLPCTAKLPLQLGVTYTQRSGARHAARYSSPGYVWMGTALIDVKTGRVRASEMYPWPSEYDVVSEVPLAPVPTPDQEFVGMVCYFWDQKQDPERYTGWDEARCERLMPDFLKQWKKFKRVKERLRALHDKYDQL